MMLLKEQWESCSSKELFMRKKNYVQKRKGRKSFQSWPTFPLKFKEPVYHISSSPAAGASTSWCTVSIHGALQKNTLTRELKKKRKKNWSSTRVWARPVKWKFFTISGERQWQPSLQRKQPLPGKKKQQHTHTPTHTRIVNLQGDKGSWPFNCRGDNRNLQFVN